MIIRLIKKTLSSLNWQRQPEEPYVGTVVSYPKSGRTWLRVILDELELPFQYTHDQSNKRRFEELSLGSKVVYRKKPVIFIMRDPRDVVVSYFFEKAVRGRGFDGTLSDFIRSPLRGVEKNVRFNLAWLELGRRLPAFMPITYEEMDADATSVILEIVNFVGAEITHGEIDRAVRNNTFQKMREREARGEYADRYGNDLRATDLADAESFKVRRGKIGGFVDYLAAEDVALCNEILEKHQYQDRVARLLAQRRAGG